MYLENGWESSQFSHASLAGSRPNRLKLAVFVHAVAFLEVSEVGESRVLAVDLVSAGDREVSLQGHQEGGWV